MFERVWWSTACWFLYCWRLQLRTKITSDAFPHYAEHSRSSFLALWFNLNWKKMLLRYWKVFPSPVRRFSCTFFSSFCQWNLANINYLTIQPCSSLELCWPVYASHDVFVLFHICGHRFSVGPNSSMHQVFCVWNWVRLTRLCIWANVMIGLSCFF